MCCVHKFPLLCSLGLLVAAASLPLHLQRVHRKVDTYSPLLTTQQRHGKRSADRIKRGLNGLAREVGLEGQEMPVYCTKPKLPGGKLTMQST